MLEGPQKPLHTAKRNVHQKLGRVLVILQVYERDLKLLLAHSNIETVQTDDGFRHNLDDNKAAVRTKTMGQLFKQYTGSHVILPKSDPVEQIAESDVDNEPYDGKIRVKTSYSCEMDSVEFDKLQARLSELLTLRNELVHHFLERFDLQDEASFLAASDYLDDSFTIVRSVMV